MRKHQTAMSIYNGHKGESTVKAVWSFVPQELQESLTGKELGLVLNAINAAYQAGKASTGAEKIDNNAVYVDGKIVEYKQI